MTSALFGVLRPNAASEEEANKMHRQIIFGLILFAPMNISADDANLGTEGGNVFPEHNNSIQMTKEDVIIRCLPDSCRVKCKFWFLNTKKNKDHLSLKMGFPDFQIDPGRWTQPITDFTCKVNGKQTEVTHEKQIGIHDEDSTLKFEKYWYSWGVNIDSNDTLIVENTYTGEWGNRSDGTLDFSYVIGTASTWYGPIGNGRITFDFSNLCTQYLLIDPAKSFTKNKIAVRRYDDSLVYSFSNHTPYANEHLSPSFYLYWLHPFWLIHSVKDNHAGIEDLMSSQETIIDSFPYTNLQFRIMRNEIYAHHGYIFKDNALQTYFSDRKWYKASTAFTIDSLNHFEKGLVKIIKAREEKK